MKSPLPTRDGISPSCLWLPEGNWNTIYDFLIERFPQLEPSMWKYRLEQDGIMDENGICYRPETAYQGGVKLYYYRQLDDEVHVPFEETILYDDEHFIVADKPHFLTAVPSGKYLHQTLLVRLKKRFGLDHITPMHRIDRETAGIMLFSKNPETRGTYQVMFQNREMHKTYEAIAPKLEHLQFPYTHRSCMVKSEPFFRMKEAEEGDVNSETHIEVIETQGNLARYHLKPVSGKQHQLRVHLSGLGAPILNDQFYPTVYPEREPDDFADPLQLLAKSIAFIDPITGEERYFESERMLHFPD